MGEFVHFRGKDAIVTAYEQNKVPSFALVSGKDLLYQYTGDDIDEGAAMLGDFIEMLAEGMSVGTYQLRMYRNPPSDLTLKVPYNFSFKCKLLEQDKQLDWTNENSVYAHKIKALEEQLRTMQQEPEEEQQEAPGWQAKIGAMLNRPEVQNYFIAKAFPLMDKFFDGIGKVFCGSPSRPAAVAGVPEEAKPDPGPAEVVDSSALYMKLAEDQRAALDQAMAILLQNDPEIGTNLLKCALLLKTNPGKYRFAVSML